MPFNITQCLLSLKQYVTKDFVTQVAASIIKALIESITVVLHYCMSHVWCDCFNFLSYNFIAGF